MRLWIFNVPLSFPGRWEYAAIQYFKEGAELGQGEFVVLKTV